jgi:hypothetical protein
MTSSVGSRQSSFFAPTDLVMRMTAQRILKSSVVSKNQERGISHG